MATIVNTPAPQSNGGSNALVQLVLGLAFLGILAGFLFYILPPLMRNFTAPSTTIEVPDEINVEVQQGE